MGVCHRDECQLAIRDAILLAGLVRPHHNVDEHKEEARECGHVENGWPTAKKHALGTKSASTWNNQQCACAERGMEQEEENVLGLTFVVILEEGKGKSTLTDQIAVRPLPARARTIVRRRETNG